MRFVLLSALLALPAMAQVKFPEAYPPTNDIGLDNLVPVKMRDGVIIRARDRACAVSATERPSIRAATAAAASGAAVRVGQTP